MPTKSQAQAYLDGDARSFPLSVEVARDAVSLQEENERLRTVLGAARALIFSDAATLIRGRGDDLSDKSEAAIFLRELTAAVHDFDEAKGGTNAGE